MQIYKFNNILKPVLWGGDKLVTLKGLPACGEPIGESWELSAMPGRESVVIEGPDQGLTLTELVRRYGADLVGEDVYRRYGDHFPLLVKVIDAKRDLSIQVHPSDSMARRLHGCSGKNEMWYILHAEEGALIRTGFNRTLTLEEFDRRLGDGTLLDVVNATESRRGEVFYIPAGQIHAIGAGNLLVEIQQSCDVTYRVWDYDRRDADGNLRELHTAQAREALNFTARDGQVHDIPCDGRGLSILVRSDEFDVYHLDVVDGYRLDCPQPHSFVALFCIDGQVTLEADGMPAATLHQCETALVPAIAGSVAMTGSAHLLMSLVRDKG